MSNLLILNVPIFFVFKSNKWGSSRMVQGESTGPDWFETKMADAKLEKKRSSKCFWSSSFVVDPTTHFHYKVSDIIIIL